MKRGLGIVATLATLAQACATTPPPCEVGPRSNPPRAAAPGSVNLSELLRSVVQIKVKVNERMVEGRLEEGFEYGTGFFVNDRGLILTSAHVLAGVRDPRDITVYHAGRRLQARPLTTYRQVDLATLLVDAGETTPLVFSERKPRLGERVFAVGFPYVDVFRDREPAVSVGHVAGADRRVVYEGRPIKDLLLTDAFVADGCSGGPLLDEHGEVLGVLRFNLARRGSWLGLSFAEPIRSYTGRKEAEP